MEHKLFVYGTLRPGNSRTYEIPGELYDLGWFPGVKLTTETNSHFVAEIIEASDERLEELDKYEGYRPDQEPSSLYLRREITVDGIKGWIYIYNHPLDKFKYIPGGDWLKRKEGREMIEEVGVA